jgi:hypothetical protein
MLRQRKTMPEGAAIWSRQAPAFFKPSRPAIPPKRCMLGLKTSDLKIAFKLLDSSFLSGQGELFGLTFDA